VDVTPEFEIPTDMPPGGVSAAIGCTECKIDTSSIGGIIMGQGGIGTRSCAYWVCEKVGSSTRCSLQWKTEACVWSEAALLFGGMRGWY
jgi:hypothetical protein